jgi:hypothetical protein
MLEDKPEDVEIMKERYNQISKTFDEGERAFEGRLYRELEWLVGRLYAENEFFKKALSTLESRIQEERRRAVQR